MQLFKRIVDNRDMNSLSTRMRRKRFAFFESLLKQIPRPLRILDVGGTQRFWETMNFAETGIEVTLLNVKQVPVSLPDFTSIAGDARNMAMFRDNEFDVVFSNSVIEHVGSFPNQQRMGQEVMRVGKRYFVQTPNRYFPIEPHFLYPYFQFWPMRLRVYMLSHFNVGWWKRIPDPAAARAELEHIHLLSEQQLRTIFPNAQLYHEQVLGLTKSFVAYSGWPA